MADSENPPPHMYNLSLLSLSLPYWRLWQPGQCTRRPRGHSQRLAGPRCRPRVRNPFLSCLFRGRGIAFPAPCRGSTARCTLLHTDTAGFYLSYCYSIFFVRLKHYVFYYSFRLLKFISIIPWLLCQSSGCPGWGSDERNMKASHGPAHQARNERETGFTAVLVTSRRPEQNASLPPQQELGALRGREAGLRVESRKPRETWGGVLPAGVSRAGRRAPGAAARGGTGRWRSERLAGWRGHPSSAGLFGADRA